MNIYDINIASLSGEENMLSGLSGKVCMFINITTKSGYTPKCSNLWSYARTARSLWDLQTLHEMFGERGFSVVGVPCNQFGGQEPSDNKQISAFVKEHYPFVSFPITEKIEVNGPNEHELYTALKGVQRRRKDDNRANGGSEAELGRTSPIRHWQESLIMGRNSLSEGTGAC